MRERDIKFNKSFKGLDSYSDIMKEKNTVGVIDFGGQYSHLIARRCRELKVHSEVVPSYTPIERVEELGPKGIILSGGPASVYQKSSPKCDPKILELGVPILGICYGAQLIAMLKKGTVKRIKRREYGKTKLFVDDREDLLRGLPDATQVWMSHGDRIESVPGSKTIAHTPNSPIAAFRVGNAYGIQFHTEVAHTAKGKEILSNFLYGICNCKPTWTPKSFVKRIIPEIKNEVGEGRVICALSGGIDSSVTARLVQRAVGNRLTCIFVNHGFMRKGEPQRVVQTFKSNFKMNLVPIDARQRFLEKLKGVRDSEEKRKIIGEEFIRVFEEQAERLKKIDFLAQGTIYPDRIESAAVGAGASRIKSHHNVGGLPERMRLGLVEPIKELYKDEVREVAREVGLPEEIISQHPFPGPGLATRIIGEVTDEKLRICRDASAIVEEELRKASLYEKVWQAFAVVGDDLATGVMGDARKEGHLVTVRIVESVDAMTADFSRLPWNLLEEISKRITNEVEGVTWVSYTVSSKPPSTIEPC